MKKNSLPSILKIRRGLNIPIAGAPEQETITDSTDSKDVTKVALLGLDYLGLKPTMAVQEGDSVKLGQLLFTDKKMEGVKYTSPASGKVLAINRGDKRAFLSIEIECSGSDAESFSSYSVTDLESLDGQKVQTQLIDSGAWVALRARPYSKTAVPNTKPHSIFVTAIDTNPHAVDSSLVLKHAQNIEYFQSGLTVLSKLTEGNVLVCATKESSAIIKSEEKIKTVTIKGPHPAGNAGTHIHFLDPVSEHKMVWHINYQEVIAIGHLFTTGKIMTERIISLSGPSVLKPRIVKTRVGASISELVSNELNDKENRVISGSVLNGRTSTGAIGYLGRYHYQISALEEGRKREFLGWQSPGLNKFSNKNIYISKLMPGKKFAFDTNTHGSPRAMVPIGMYEKIMPLDILATHFLRSILVKDTEQAANLGALELDEEDLALCTFVCPGKIDYGPELRETLMLIEKGE